MNQISWKQSCWSSKQKAASALMSLNFARDWLLQCCLLFKATLFCFFMATIVSNKTMTSLRLKSLQLNRDKFSRKSYPRVGKAFVLNNPLYNLKISDYFCRNSMINLDKGRFPYWKYCKKSLIFNVKSLHPILIYFTWNLAGMID